MQDTTKKFLQFNGKNVYFLSAQGVWWIAIKPICEALGVNYDRQYKNLKQDKILGQLYAMQHTTGADSKQYKMVCLPEFFVYGWLFSIQSDNENLTEYKWKCYELLYNYFHGTITDRFKLLKVQTQADLRMEALEKELQQNESYKELMALKSTKNAAKKALSNLDNEVITNQLDLWRSEE